jgi:potassium efflux system protein
LEEIPIPLLGSLNALQVLQALVIAVVTYYAVRNLPGLLELAVLRSTSFEPGTRNAISTLGQYAVTGFGLVLLSNVLKLDWERFGWMAAALSVGLGFGLQEIVANFVCGIILLFEQPIRVGDVVTLDTTTGTVTAIHLRATTITNWDRQDFVVPNKNLITGTILNWTLNGSVNRIVLPVGVAYGTDTDHAQQILLDIADSHPAVLKDPKPIASVEQFADSSVNLMLRAYLAELGQRIGTTSELLTEIQKRFNAAGIEIPFPQQDLHLRGGWEKVSPGEVDGSEQEQEPSFGPR